MRLLKRARESAREKWEPATLEYAALAALTTIAGISAIVAVAG
ncbi:MAG TPA: hypothetical protein VHG92_08525 [Afifellaceae bacterium]|nr:hypothetical protein [Afifellaceae bacterium]